VSIFYLENLFILSIQHEMLLLLLNSSIFAENIDTIRIGFLISLE